MFAQAIIDRYDAELQSARQRWLVQIRREFGRLKRAP